MVIEEKQLIWRGGGGEREVEGWRKGGVKIMRLIEFYGLCRKVYYWCLLC